MEQKTMSLEGTKIMYPEKRELDGIYIRVQRGGKGESVCLSDCDREERYNYLEKLTDEQMDRVDDHIDKCFRGIVMTIAQNDTEREFAKEISKVFENKLKIGSWTHASFHAVNTSEMIGLMRKIAEGYDITRADPED